MTPSTLSFLTPSPLLQQLYTLLNEPPFTTRFVGGCVRDNLLNRAVTDVDMATTAVPAAVLERLQQHGIKALKHGLEHGTVTAVLESKQSIEITTLRKDIKTDGRHAVVAFTEEWAVDAARRDFTMNALYADDTGQIYDPLGTGIADAQAGIVRFIGDPEARITEDALRILRYFRFLPVYHNSENPVEEDALAACEKLAPMIERLSGERIQQEMLKLLAMPRSLPALRLMQQTGVLDYVLDKAVVPDLSETSLLAKLQETAHPHSPMMVHLWALLGGNEEAIERITRRWKLPRALSSQLFILSDVNPLEINLQDAPTRWRLMDAHPYTTLHDIITLYCAAHSLGDTPLHKTLLEEAFESRLLKFPLSGKDLKAIGITEGVAMGEALRKARQAWVESGFTLGKQDIINKLIFL
jgi:poly(A) polymerase